MSVDAWWFGKAALSRSKVCFSAIDVGSDFGLSEASVMLSAGIAMAPSTSTEITSVRAGRRSEGRSNTAHRRDSRSCIVHRHSTGTRGRSMPLPSSASNAGSTVSEPSTAIATTMIEPVPSDSNVTSPVRNSPSIDTMTAAPETSTECPAVSAAISIASSLVCPAWRSARARFT